MRTLSVPCTKTNRVGGQAFSNVPPEPNLGSGPKLSTLFAHACSTAFAGLSYRLSPRNLTGEAAKLGIGVPWKLPIPAFTGKIANPGTNARELAEDTVGTRHSPGQSARHGAGCRSGRLGHLATRRCWSTDRQPSSRPSQRSDGRVAAELRSFMRATVTSGAARAANLPGVHSTARSGPHLCLVTAT